MKKLFYLLTAALMSASAVMAEDVVYTCDTGSGSLAAIGRGRNVEHDLAIFINNPAYIGYEITGISVEIPNVDGCACEDVGRAWVTKELTSIDSNNMYKFTPDIMSVEAALTNYGTIRNPKYRFEVKFPEPYVLTKDGIYVGYSLTVSELANWTATYPLQVRNTPNPEKNGPFVHYALAGGGSPLGYNRAFQNMSDACVSTMRVTLSGHQAENAASVETNSKFFGVLSDNSKLNVVVTNIGLEQINNLSYSIILEGSDNAYQTNTINLPSGLPSGASRTVALPFIVPAQSGDYNFEVSIDKINGKDNESSVKSASFLAYARPFIPHKRVLIEEYTGLWCGDCPEAYVAIKQLQDIHNDDVVVISMHNGDSMTTINVSEVPIPGSTSPRMYLDRNDRVTAFNVSNNYVLEHLNQLAPADMKIDLYWDDKNHKQYRAVADLKFAEPVEADQYRLAFALVEDDMSDPSWTQRNFFSNTKAEDNEWYQTPYWDLFIGKQFEQPGIVYDDIALLFPDCHGIENSVPAIQENNNHKFSVVFNPSDVKSGLIKNSSKLRVVGMLLDKNTGNAVNAASSGYSVDLPVYVDDLTGVETLPAENASAVVAEEYYNAEGIRLAECPAKGIVIVVRRFADGSVKTTKLAK